MKTGYDQFFKKVKETNSDPQKSRPMSSQQKQSNMYTSKKIRRPFPIKSVFSFALIALAAFFTLDQSDYLESLLKKIEINMSSALAEEKLTATAEAKNEKSAENKATDGKAVAKDVDKDRKDAKPDEADYLFKLSERNKQLDQREEDLKKLEAEIAKQKEDLDQKLKKLEETRQKISTALEEKIKADDSKVETLVQMYSNMKAQQAAKVFENLDEELVIEILSRMKKKSAADILNLIKPEKAQIFAERYVGYRRAPAAANANKGGTQQ